MQEVTGSTQHTGAIGTCLPAQSITLERKGRSPKAPAVEGNAHERAVRSLGSADHGRAGAARKEEARTGCPKRSETRPGYRPVQPGAMGK